MPAHDAAAIVAPLYPALYEDFLKASLQEDLGRAGDITTDTVVPADARAHAALNARDKGVVAGLSLGLHVFRLLSPDLKITQLRQDGDRVNAGDCLARIEGLARPILTGERVCLNLIGRLSGIASETAKVVDAVAGTGTQIVCTRKTTPGLRGLEKFAIRCGGGHNHRFGLDDAVMIKDNHIVAAGGLAEALHAARSKLGHMVKIEVEVDTLEQLAELLPLDADVVLLDNMAPDMLREAVKMVDGRMKTEASGGLTPDTVRAVAETGVDLISLGWLTHSVNNFDVGLDFSAL